MPYIRKKKNKVAVKVYCGRCGKMASRGHYYAHVFVSFRYSFVDHADYVTEEVLKSHTDKYRLTLCGGCAGDVSTHLEYCDKASSDNSRSKSRLMPISKIRQCEKKEQTTV